MDERESFLLRERRRGRRGDEGTFRPRRRHGIKEKETKRGVININNNGERYLQKGAVFFSNFGAKFLGEEFMKKRISASTTVITTFLRTTS